GGDANVATGYHAIEFLLWGQDQDYASFVKDSVSNGAMTSGQRALSDFTTEANAQRRLAYLEVAAAKIVSDLTVVAGAWSKNISVDCMINSTGCYRGALLGTLEGEDASKNIDAKIAKKTIFAGMGVFIKSEVANERIAVAVLTPSEEDEHSCFSDNTHRDIATNYQGFKNILMGTYKDVDFGAAPIDAMQTEAKDELMKLMSKIEIKIASIDSIAKTSRHFDYQIQPNDPQTKVIVKLKNELRKLGDKMVFVALANGVNLSIEDVTDAEETKF
ncbi:MAG: imelysin, partial [Sulfurimonas sp.]|nr:imelysin [Sulfurimonas sp.]